MKKFLIYIAVFAAATASLCFAGCEDSPAVPSATVYADVTVTDENSVQVSARISAKHLPEADKIPFALYPLLFSDRDTLPVTDDSFSSACPDGFVPGEVFDLTVSGDVAAYEVEGATIFIYPRQASEYADEYEICFDYSLTLPQCEMRYGYDDFAVRLADFLPRLCVYDGEYCVYPYYPTGDPFAYDAADYEVRLSYPDEFTLAAPGNVAVTEDCATIALDDARDFTVVLFRDPQIAVASSDKFEVTAYACDKAKARAAADSALSAYSYFRDKLGAPCRDKLTIAVLPFYAGGMEYCGIVYLSDSLSAAQTAACAVHETAHVWWYDSVGFDQVLEPWKDESLAQACTFAYFCDSLPPFGYAMLETALSAAEQSGDTCRTLAEYASESDYYATVYCKASTELYSLRSSLGDEQFFGAMRDCFQSLRGGVCPRG